MVYVLRRTGEPCAFTSTEYKSIVGAVIKTLGPNSNPALNSALTSFSPPPYFLPMSYYCLTPEIGVSTGKECGWPWRSSSSTSLGPPPPPMPSLTTHPPLRLQRKPVAGTTLPEIRANADTPPEIMMEDSPSPPAHQPTSSREPTPEEQSFPCPYCPAIFKKVGHLNRHAFKHTGTRFACEIPGCGKTFSRLDNMRTQ
jgi:hypothetical protein